MSAMIDLIDVKSETRLVAVASTTSLDAFSTRRLVLVAFDLPYSSSTR
jgi:hypothetical protein